LSFVDPPVLRLMLQRNGPRTKHLCSQRVQLNPIISIDKGFPLLKRQDAHCGF